MSKYLYYLEDQDGNAVGSLGQVYFQSAKDARLHAQTHFPKERLTVKALLRSARAHCDSVYRERLLQLRAGLMALESELLSQKAVAA